MAIAAPVETAGVTRLPIIGQVSQDSPNKLTPWFNQINGVHRVVHKGYRLRAGGLNSKRLHAPGEPGSMAGLFRL